jgi:hypothetical protein
VVTAINVSASNPDDRQLFATCREHQVTFHQVFDGNFPVRRRDACAAREADGGENDFTRTASGARYEVIAVSNSKGFCAETRGHG